MQASISTNTSNKIVLQAAVNADPNPYKDFDDMPLISGNSLVAEIGPSGTASEVEKEVINTQISLYVVREGDTLLDIANMFNVTPNTIIWANDLERNAILKKDQKLVILPISGIKYTFKKGDTIKGVVLKYKSDIDEVLKYNDLTLSSVIIPGDIIIIPDAEPTIDKLAKKLAGNNVHDANGPYYPGYYIRPIDGGFKSQELHGYNAVDIAASVGTPIHAAASGTVISSVTGGWNGGYGNYVIISHPNGTQTLYAHNQKNFVKVGDKVVQDQIIARVGNTGKSTGPHVHFEIRGARNPF
jgi:murein DD-endopeptidase MepM/ murein hydrolase activator NlpD